MEEEIKELIASGKRGEAIEKLEAYLLQIGQREEMLLWLGELLYAEGKMTEALNRFNAVLRLNPENRKAGNYVSMINSILGYFCKDLLNP